LRERTTDAAKTALNRAVAPFGVKIVRRSDRNEDAHDWSDIASYIPFEATLDAAERAGLSLGDYIDSVMNGIPGATQATIEQMAALGVFAGPIETIVEIGPGSGRYVEKTLAACTPLRYEIYETAAIWGSYVAKKYKAIFQPTDGKSLAATATGSVDLLQAHKVFSAIPFLTTARYWLEMFRVMRPGGRVVFDIMTEPCMSPTLVTSWISSGRGAGTYPALIPRVVVVDFFESHGFRTVGSFIVPMGPGKTEMFVFRKHDAA
jgi:hypothetical protein